METNNTRGQGLTITDPETGRVYAIPQGGSDNGVSVGDGGGTVEGSGDGVQSTDTGGSEAPSTTEGSGSEGQGFLEPYLRDIPEEQRAIVQPVLERMRQEQDRNFNQRFEQVREETRIPTTIYNALLNDPLQTLDWIADRMVEERGIDIRSELKSRWYASQEGGEQLGQGQNDQSSQDPNQPLTQAQLDQILEQREQQKQQQTQQEQFQKQQVEQQTRTVNGWVEDAAKKFSLSLEDKDGQEDPLRPVIIMQANALHEQGIARGQAAIEMAVESVARRFGSNGQSKESAPQPNLANGGTPPPSQDFDVMDPAQRKARMVELMSPPPVA